MCRRLSRSCLFPAPTSREVWLCGLEVQARVDPLSLPAHVCSAVATVLKCLLVLCLALVFPVSLTAQLLPSSIAETQMAVSADMQDGCVEPQAPCTISGRAPARSSARARSATNTAAPLSRP